MRPYRLCLIALAASIWLIAAHSTVSAQFRGRGGPTEGDSRDRDGDSDDRRGRDRRWGDDSGGRGFDSRGDSGSRWGGFGSRDGDSGFRRGGFGSRGDSDSRDGDSGSREGDSRSRRGFGSFGGGFGPPGGGFGPPGFGPPGGFRPSPEMFFDRLDRNGDGRLGEDEISQSGPFQGMLERAGIREGASRDDFSKGFERLRENSGNSENSRERSDSRDRRNDTGYTPAKRERVTVDLPGDFFDRDQDGDGQIGLYEWREWDRTRIDEFFFLDRNGDGFLTPRELASVANSSNDDDRTSASRNSDGNGPRKAESRRFEPRPPEQSSAAAPQSAPAVAALDENDADVRKGRQYFKLIDGDGDGRATVEELGKIQKMRPMFEEAGVRLDQEMSADQFVANYVKAVRFK